MPQSRVLRLQQDRLASTLPPLADIQKYEKPPITTPFSWFASAASIATCCFPPGFLTFWNITGHNVQQAWREKVWLDLTTDHSLSSYCLLHALRRLFHDRSPSWSVSQWRPVRSLFLIRHPIASMAKCKYRPWHILRFYRNERYSSKRVQPISIDCRLVWRGSSPFVPPKLGNLFNLGGKSGDILQHHKQNKWISWPFFSRLHPNRGT